MKNKYDNIGTNIKILREKSKITQKKLALFLKVDQSLISKIEKNQRNITTDLLEKIATLFGISSETFFENQINATPIAFSLRATELSIEDLETISHINKIAFNLKFMNNALRNNNE